MGGPLHNRVTALLSLTLVIIGIAIVVSTIARGGGPTAYGVIVGICFAGAGAARLWLAMRGPGNG